MTSKEIEEKHGMAVAELDALSRDAENGVFHGEVREFLVAEGDGRAAARRLAALRAKAPWAGPSPR